MSDQGGLVTNGAAGQPYPPSLAAMPQPAMQPQPQQIAAPAPEPIPAAKLALIAASKIPNLVPELPAEKITGIAQTVIDEYAIDKTSRAEWEKRNSEAMELAMLVSKAKSYPWANAANIKFPLLTVAALQFNARAYPAIVQGNRVVKCATWGKDPQGKKAARGERVSEHMSYQLLAEQLEWEEDTDKLLVILPIAGSCFRKAYFDPSIGHNTSRLVTSDRLVVNYWAKGTLDTIPRVTEEMHLYPHEIKERIRSGRFIKFDYDQAPAGQTDTDAKKKDQPSENDKQAPHLFLEQHRLLDLDDDGYEEPYIVTIHHSTQQICRIVANYSADTISMDGDKIAAIRKMQYYVKYGFFPAPDGSFYDIGLGWLMKDIQEAINTVTSMMLDMGHQATVQGGFISAAMGLKEKHVVLAPGEFRVLKTSIPVNQAVYPINFPGPSPVLFNLLGLLVDAGKEIGSVKDVLTGEGQGKNASPTTTLALIEQGLMVFTAIYKRIFRALKAEYGIYSGLNREHVSAKEYNDFFDGDEQFDPAVDYGEADKDILPIADPAMVSRMQQLSVAEFLHQTLLQDQRGILNPKEVYTRMFEAGNIPDVDKLIAPPQQEDPAHKAMLERAAAAEVEGKEAAVRVQESQILVNETAAALNEAKSGMNEAQIEEMVARLLMEHSAAQQPTPEAPAVDPNIVQADEMQKHQDNMNLQHRTLDEQMALEREKLAAQKTQVAAKAGAPA